MYSCSVPVAYKTMGRLHYCRVHIVAHPANRYIVAFHIAISRYRTIFTHIPDGSNQGTHMAGALVYTEVMAVMYGCRCVNLQTQIRILF